MKMIKTEGCKHKKRGMAENFSAHAPKPFRKKPKKEI